MNLQTVNTIIDQIKVDAVFKDFLELNFKRLKEVKSLSFEYDDINYESLRRNKFCRKLISDNKLLLKYLIFSCGKFLHVRFFDFSSSCFCQPYAGRWVFHIALLKTKPGLDV